MLDQLQKTSTTMAKFYEHTDIEFRYLGQLYGETPEDRKIYIPEVFIAVRIYQYGGKHIFVFPDIYDTLTKKDIQCVKDCVYCEFPELARENERSDHAVWTLCFEDLVWDMMLHFEEAE